MLAVCILHLAVGYKLQRHVM